MLRILHLSDIHLGYEHKHGAPQNMHFFKKTEAGAEHPDPQQLVDLLVRDSELRTPPDVTVISGDLTWCGRVGDYAHVEEFMKQLRSRWTSTRFVLVPGNHDVDWEAGSDGEAAG